MDLRELPRQQGTSRHPWEVARARALVRILREAGLPRGVAALDIGCGDGYCGQYLRTALGFSRLCGLDSELRDADCARLSVPEQGVQYSHDPAAIKGRFDLFLLLDVLEHIEDDVGFLRARIETHLVEDGQVLITVPAFQQLFSQHDSFLQHFRRYNLAQLSALVESSGLVAQRSGYLFGSLLLPRALGVLRERFLPARFSGSVGLGGWRGGPLLSGLVANMLDLDNRWMLTLGERLGLPGLSGWALCRRR